MHSDHPEVTALLARSNRLGADRRNTNHGGGNTSAKGTLIDPVTGEPTEVMWVKGSGGDLRTLAPAGLAVLRLDRILALRDVYPGPASEDRMHQLLEHCLFGSGGAAPSIDTSIHALIDAPHVDHLHPDAVIAIAAAADGPELTARCFTGELGWVPWRRPGFELALQIEALQRDNPGWRGVVMGGHGLVTWGDTSDACEQTSVEMIERATRFLEENGRPEPLGSLRDGHEALDPGQRREQMAALAPFVRGLASTDQRVVGHWSDDPLVLDFIGREAAPRVVSLARTVLLARTLALACALLTGLALAAGPEGSTFQMRSPWPDHGLAAGQEKFLGNVLRARLDLDFRLYWNQVTPEDAGKWLSVEAVRGTMVWSVLDLIYDYARAHGLPVKQHTFVWGQQEPRWVANLPPDEQLAEVDEWMRLFAERYPDTAYVDVVNEPVHAPPSYAEALGGAGETGWDWVIWAFERARVYFPDAELLINEYNILCCARDRAEYLEVVRVLQERGLVDGIGVQGHGLEQVSAEVIRAALDEVAALGLPIYVSELDLNTHDDEAQLAMYQRVFPVLWEHPAVAGVTLWGYRAGQTWRNSAFLLDWFDEERPALTWLRGYLQGE